MSSVPMLSALAVAPVTASETPSPAGKAEDRFHTALLAFFADLPGVNQATAMMVGTSEPPSDCPPEDGEDPVAEEGTDGDATIGVRPAVAIFSQPASALAPSCAPMPTAEATTGTAAETPPIASSPSPSAIEDDRLRPVSPQGPFSQANAEVIQVALGPTDTPAADPDSNSRPVPPAMESAPCSTQEPVGDAAEEISAVKRTARLATATADRRNETVPTRGESQTPVAPSVQAQEHGPVTKTVPSAAAAVDASQEASLSQTAEAPPRDHRRQPVEGGSGTPLRSPLHSPASVIASLSGPVHVAPGIHSPGMTSPPQGTPVAVVTPAVAGERITEVLSSEILRTTPAGEHRIEITLHPPDLGRVEVSLVVGREAIHAHLVAHTEGARDLLTQQLTDLRQHLVSHGFSDPQLSVDLRHGSDERHWQRSDGERQTAPREDHEPLVAPSIPRASRRGDQRLFHRVA